MNLIKPVGMRKNRNWNPVAYYLFQCPECNAEVERGYQSGLKTATCGCNKYVRDRRKKTERTCLMCNKKFMSWGPGNHRCARCDKKIYQAGDNTYYETPVFKMHHRNIHIDTTSEKRFVE